jgi:hypothetical protein
MGSGCGTTLRGFTERAFPYANLASVDDLSKWYVTEWLTAFMHLPIINMERRSLAQVLLPASLTLLSRIIQVGGMCYVISVLAKSL